MEQKKLAEVILQEKAMVQKNCAHLPLNVGEKD